MWLTSKGHKRIGKLLNTQLCLSGVSWVGKQVHFSKKNYKIKVTTLSGYLLPLFLLGHIFASVSFSHLSSLSLLSSEKCSLICATNL